MSHSVVDGDVGEHRLTLDTGWACSFRAAGHPVFVVHGHPHRRGQRLADSRAADDLVELIDLIGAAIVVTHRTSSAAGWRLLRRRPPFVQALVAVDPVDDRGPRSGPGDVDRLPPTASGEPDLRSRTVAVVPRLPDAPKTRRVLAALLEAGIDPEVLRLPPHEAGRPGWGATGPQSSPDVLAVIRRWLDHVLEGPGMPSAGPAR